MEHFLARSPFAMSLLGNGMIESVVIFLTFSEAVAGSRVSVLSPLPPLTKRLITEAFEENLLVNVRAHGALLAALVFYRNLREPI